MLFDLFYLSFLTFYVVNLCVHSYSVCKFTIRMVHVQICPTFSFIGRHARFSEAVHHMLVTFPPLISFLSFTLSMITHNWCVINSGTYRVECFTGV